MKKIGGLTVNQRAKFWRLQRQLAEAANNTYLRLNDEDARSFRSRTISARKMVEIATEIHRLLARA